MMKKVKKKKSLDVINLILLIIILLANIGLAVLCFFIKDYYLILPNAISYIYLIIGVAIVLMDFLAIVGIVGKDKKFIVISAILSLILIVVSGFGITYLGKLTGSINKMINDNVEIKNEDIEVEYVTYENDSWDSLENIRGKTVGVLNTSSDEDFTSIGIENLEAEGLGCTYVHYDTYNDLFLALISKEVDAAIFAKDYEGIFAANEGYDEYLAKIKTFATYTKTIEKTIDLANEKDITKEPFTVLLIGYAPESDNSGLSDSVIVASINPLSLSVTLQSIARDSYVPIACYSNGASDKLTHSRAVSRDCLIETVENLLNTEIDYYAEINFHGVVDVVDALDGITVYNDIEFIGQSADTTRGKYTVWVPGYGDVAMNGEQALAFARERHAMPNGDYDRQLNQQKVIKAIIKRALELKDIDKILNVIDAAGDNFSTNVSRNQILAFLNYILSINTTNGKLDPFNMIQITSSRVTGYASWSYSYSMNLPLWIYKLWQGSIKDNVDLLDNNMMRYSSINQDLKFSFFIDYPYYKEPYVIKEYYDEPQEHEEMPNFVKNFVGENESTVVAWASSVGLPLNIVYIREGDSGYDPSLAVGTVVDQSAKYGTLCSSLSSFTITVNGQSVAEEDKVPYFVGSNISIAKKWCSNNGISYELKALDNNEISLAGQVVSQSVSAGSDKNVVTSITFEYYGAAAISSAELTKVIGYSEEAAAAYLESIGVYNYQFVEASSSGGYSCGTVISISPTSGTTDTVYTLSYAPHNYELISTDEKCTSEGTKTYKCRDCGKTYTETISPVGHSCSSYTPNGDGKSQNGVCTRCGETINACIYGGTYPDCIENNPIEP